MNIRDEIIHHIVPSASGAGIAMSLGEHFLYSVGVGVAVYCITHVISIVVKQIIKKVQCKK
jgi:hypothetical protein